LRCLPKKAAKEECLFLTDHVKAFYMSRTQDILQFKEQHHITFPVGKARGVAKELRVATIPEIIFLSRDGEFVKRLKGKISYEQLKEGIDEILKEKN
jgi:thioredoxin-related protein